MRSFSLEIYAMPLGRKGEEQRTLAASAVSQLSSAHNNKYAKAVYLEVHVLTLCEGNNWVLWWGRDALLQIGWLQKDFLRNWHLLWELKAGILDSQVKIPRRKFADRGNSIAALWQQWATETALLKNRKVARGAEEGEQGWAWRRWGQGIIRGWILWGPSEPWKGIWIPFWMPWGTSEDLHLRVTQASVLKSLHRICVESRF